MLVPKGSINSIHEWRNRSEIDYFPPFNNAWLAFNAWMRTTSQETTDRAMLEYVKSTQNPIRRAFNELLQGEDEISTTFKSDLSSLHFQLERVEIPAGRSDAVNKLSFTQIVSEENTENEYADEYNRMQYRVERFITGGNKGQVRSTIFSLVKQSLHFAHHQDKYNLPDLLQQQAYMALSINQRTNLRNCYHQVNPKRPVSLLSDTSEAIQIGQFMFVNDLDRLFKGVIHALYCIRNGLFHGEIVPDRDTNELYGAAYRVLKKLIDVL